MLGRYAELKAQLPQGTILFYQVGTFFETFEEDAKTISRELSLRLTSREAAGDGRPRADRRGEPAEDQGRHQPGRALDLRALGGGEGAHAPLRGLEPQGVRAGREGPARRGRWGPHPVPHLDARWEPARAGRQLQALRPGLWNGPGLRYPSQPRPR